MTKEEKKFYPFSNTTVPDEYDGFLLLNKKDGETIKINTNDGEKEVFNGKITFQNNEMTPEQNSEGKFKCLVADGKGYSVHLHLCHIFTIIDKDEEVIGDWKDKCPTSLDELRPLSLKNRGLVENNYKANFPKVFLVAMKWKNTNTPYEWFEINGEKKIENIHQLLLSFPKENNSNYPIFSWYDRNTPERRNVLCNKDLLNSKS